MLEKLKLLSGKFNKMDIPESGAVFTLGKSYLSDNHQSYFFIKNDAVKKLISGCNQSGVICESGRLFVWGENQCGQLGIGSITEIITKPSCVKTIKTLGHKVRNVAFGETFSVILTESSKVYFTGKTIFDYNIGLKDKLQSKNQIKKPIELEEFQEYVIDDNGNIDEFVDISAGQFHFIVLSSRGRLYGWGTNTCYQINGDNKLLHLPVLISGNDIVRIGNCGKTSTIYITENNEIYIRGMINNVNFTDLTKLNTSICNELIYSLHISQADEIFLLTSSREIYKSTVYDSGRQTIEFEKVLTFSDTENIRKISSGSGFVSVVTDTNKFITTFNEKSSAKQAEPNVPKELKKFNNLDVVDVVSGLHHILVHAIPKRQIESTSSVDSVEMLINNNHNVVTNLEGYSEDILIDENKSEIPNLLITEHPNDDSNNNHEVIEIKENNKLNGCNSSAVILDESKSLNEFEQLEKESEMQLNDEAQTKSTQIEVKEELLDVKVHSSTIQSSPSKHSIGNDSINTIKINEVTPIEICDHDQMDTDVDNEIDRVRFEQDSGVVNEAQQLSYLVNEEENVIQKINSKRSATEEFLRNKENILKMSSIKSIDGLLEKSTEHADKSDKEKTRENIEKQLNKDEQLEIIITDKNNGEIETNIIRRNSTDPIDNHDLVDASLSTNVTVTPVDHVNENYNKVTFINNGVDVTNEVNKTFREQKIQENSDEETIIENVTKDNLEDNILGEKLNSFKNETKKSFKDSIEETKEALKYAVEDYVDAPVNARKNPTNKFQTNNNNDYQQDDGERTTASLNSNLSGKNPFNSDDDINEVVHERNEQLSSMEQNKVKRFFRELKDSSCQKIDNFIHEHDSTTTKKDQKHDDKQTSQFCTIL